MMPSRAAVVAEILEDAQWEAERDYDDFSELLARSVNAMADSLDEYYPRETKEHDSILAEATRWFIGWHHLRSPWWDASVDDGGNVVFAEAVGPPPQRG